MESKSPISMDAYISRINAELGKYFADLSVPQHRLRDAMRYSLLLGGKRIRPVLTLEFTRITGGDWESALPVACAVEMLHSYSLIHDDLPCMDDDDLRRGKPSSHIVYGEATALLAGDALQAEAFSTILSSTLDAHIRAECGRVLAMAAGESNMCGGQYLDLDGHVSASADLRASEAALMEIHSRKTAALIRAACLMGAICGGASTPYRDAADRYGSALGLAFQIRDDLLDNTGDTAVLGKPKGSDVLAGKTTFYTLYGANGCVSRIDSLTNEAKASAEFFTDSGFLCRLADSLAVRVT